MLGFAGEQLWRDGSVWREQGFVRVDVEVAVDEPQEDSGSRVCRSQLVPREEQEGQADELNVDGWRWGHAGAIDAVTALYAVVCSPSAHSLPSMVCCNGFREKSNSAHWRVRVNFR